MLRFLYTKERDIKMQWKYVVLQYLVLGPGLALKVQSLVLALALSFESLVLALALKVQSLVLALALSLKSLLTSLSAGNKYYVRNLLCDVINNA